MTIYRITWRNQIKALPWHLWATVVVMVIGLIWTGPDSTFVKFWSFAFMVTLGPAFFVHAEYYLKNRNARLVLLEDKVRFEKGYRSVEGYFDEVEKIVFRESRNYKNRPQTLPHEAYSYAQFFFRSGEQFTVTNLVVPNLERLFYHFKTEQIKRQYVFFPSLSLPVIIPGSWIIDNPTSPNSKP